MLRWLIRRKIAAFERDNGYDASYVRDILAADPAAVRALGGVLRLARYRRDVPPACWYAAGIVAVLAEDCGPCTQLAVHEAERAGVPAGVLRAVLAHDLPSLDEDARLAVRFARAVLAREAEAENLRRAILARWGRRGLVSLAFAIASARVFPTVKYALGHGRSCERVTVGDVVVPVRRMAWAA